MAVKFRDYYQVLGVARDASADDIKRAYRKLATKYHPDKNKSAEADTRFKEATEAYEVLKDADKRAKYDRLGENWKHGQDFQPPPGSGFEGFEDIFGGRGRRGPGNASGGPSSGGFSFSGDGFSEFFEMFFNQAGGAQGHGSPAGQRTAHQRPAGPTQETELTISLHEAYHGATRSITLQSADGSTKRLDVKIPAGSTTGSKIRLKGQGGGGGDLLLKLHIAHDPRFEVHGHNLTTTLKVSPFEAMLGAKVPVQTMDGDVTLTIPPGTNSGSRLRLTGKGLPKRGGGQDDRGDLFARVKIIVPKDLTDEQKELLNKLKEELKFDPRI